MTEEPRNIPYKDPIAERLFSAQAAAAGAFVGYFLASSLPYLISAVACAIIIALSASASTRVMRPILWWGNLGAIAGCTVGTSLALSDAFSDMGMTDRELWRHTAIASLAIGGLIAGVFLSRNLKPGFNAPRPKDILKAAGGLTAGTFAILVFIKFTGDGLDAARALSSRISTMTTVLVTSLVLPGYIGFRFGRWIEERFDRSRSG
jgi:hypothetical protein